MAVSTPVTRSATATKPPPPPDKKPAPAPQGPAGAELPRRPASDMRPIDVITRRKPGL